MQHHYLDPAGWLAFATLLGAEDEYRAFCQGREEEAEEEEAQTSETCETKNY